MPAVNARPRAGRLRTAVNQRPSQQKRNEAGNEARWDGPAGFLDPGQLAYLQRAAGNASVAALVAASLQRQPAPAPPSAPSAAAPASSSEDIATAGGTVRRLTVEGLTQGFQGKTRKGQPGQPTIGEAVVLIPPLAANPSAPVEVLVHLHGHGIGFRRQTKELLKTVRHAGTKVGEERDVVIDKLEAQITSTGRRMVAVMPQGGTMSEFGDNFDAMSYSEEALSKAAAMGTVWKKAPAIQGIVWSGHSGAGATFAQVMGGQKRKPTYLREVILFDAINGDGELKAIAGWLTRQLAADLRALEDAATAEERHQVLSTGFRFRGYFTHNWIYPDMYGQLEKRLSKWFTDHDPALQRLGATALRQNYLPIVDAGAIAHERVMGEKNRFAEALSALGPAGAAAPRSAKAEAAAPAATTPAPAATTPAPTTAGSPVEQLIDATASLGRADKGPKPVGGTLLRQEDVRSALENRSKNATLNAHFTSGEAAIAAAANGPAKGATLSKQAHELVRMLELQFILDPTRSALDLLPPARAKHWREFEWDPEDYPGGPQGRHEAQALKMMDEMTGVRAERRPNTGPNAVITKKQMTPERWAYVIGQTSPVEGESRSLNNEAAQSFIRMREAARADGVKLRILDGYRPPKVAEARAKKAKNPYAIASFSSHSLGLAVDLELWGGKDRKGEINTGDMKKVVDMRATPVHKWMVFRGEEFGWYPYGNEPWHWEYNPPGLKERFFKGGAVTPAVVPAPAAPAAEKAAPVAAPAADGKRLSGKHWVDEYQTSRSLDDLKDPFKGSVSAFIQMLKTNGAQVEISATYRPPERAWLMHWAWVIAKGGITYSRLGKIKNPYNVAIAWDHGTEAASRSAAAEMVSGYGMAHIAALHSRHTERRAVDMTITHLPQTLAVDGETYPIGKQAATRNEALWMVGQMFKVVKLASDPPHWSEDGH